MVRENPLGCGEERIGRKLVPFGQGRQDSLAGGDDLMEKFNV